MGIFSRLGAKIQDSIEDVSIAALDATANAAYKVDSAMGIAQTHSEEATAAIAARTHDIFERAIEVGGVAADSLAGLSSVSEDINPDNLPPHLRIIRAGASKAVEIARKTRILYTIDVRQLPQLHDDPKRDLEFKYALMAELESTLGMTRPASEQFRSIAQSAFEYGVDQERLSDVLCSDPVLGALITEIIESDYSEFRGHNIVAMGSSTIQGFSKKLKNYAAQLNKKQIIGDVEAECENYIRFYAKNYDPASQDRGVSKFINALKAEYPDHDIDTWIKSKKQALIDIVKGTDNSNVSKVVDKAYVEYARRHNKQAEYLRLTLPKEIDSYAIGRSFAEHGYQGEGGLITRQCSEADLRAMMIDLMVQHHGEAKRIKIETVVKSATNFLLSAVTINEFLRDPDRMPEDIQSDYAAMFPGGKFDRAAYTRILRNLFEVVETRKSGTEEVAREEHFTSLEARVRRDIFQEANRFLAKELSDARIDVPLDQAVNDANEYHELVHLAVKSISRRTAWDARLKIGLAFSIYHTKFNRNHQFRNHDARQIEQNLTTVKNGIELKERVTLTFYETDEGEILREMPLDAREDESWTQREMDVIVAEINGVECYLMVVNDDKDSMNFVSVKSLQSDVSKQIRKRLHAKDVPDKQRMTIIFADGHTAGKRKVEEYFSANNFNFFRKRERKQYGNGTQNAAYTSKDYVADKYFFDLLINKDSGDEITRAHKDGYLVRIELRMLELKYALIEKSHNHDAGHKPLEKRRARKSIPEYRPRALFPDLYEEMAIPNEDLVRLRDLKERQELGKNGIEYVLKSS